MKTVHYYGPEHPMVAVQSGDPARGEWKPWANKPVKVKRRKRSKGSK